jgi:CheY-like chemotaxis protein
MPDRTPKQKGTVLVVDDDPSIRLVVAKVLESNGYRVLLALSGEEALEIWRAYSSEIDLLFTDLEMSGMSGVDLAKILRSFRPGLKVLFTSGSGITVVESLLKSRESGQFLEKPYDMPDLTRAVEDAFEA